MRVVPLPGPGNLQLWCVTMGGPGRDIDGPFWDGRRYFVLTHGHAEALRLLRAEVESFIAGLKRLGTPEQDIRVTAQPWPLEELVVARRTDGDVPGGSPHHPLEAIVLKQPPGGRSAYRLAVVLVED